MVKQIHIFFQITSLIILVLVPFKIESQELPKYLTKGNFGLFINFLGNDDIQAFRLSDEYLQHRRERYGRGSSLSVFYNLFDFTSLGLKLFNIENRNYSSKLEYNQFGQPFGVYNFNSQVNRPDIEITFKLFPLKNSFYLATIIGNASPRSVVYQWDNINQWSTNTPLYTFSYDSTARYYGGLDTGFTFSFWERCLFTLGYSIKYATNPKINHSTGFSPNDFILNGDFNFYRYLLGNLITSNADNEYTFTKRGVSTLYFEMGVVF